MGVSLLFIGIPPPSLIHVEIRGLKKSMARAHVDPENQAKSGQIRAKMTPLYIVYPVLYCWCLLTILTPLLWGRARPQKGSGPTISKIR